MVKLPLAGKSWFIIIQRLITAYLSLYDDQVFKETF